LHKLLIRFLAHDLLNADRSEDFHGALADLRRSRMNCGASVMLDGQGADTVMAEQERGRHSHQAASGNQDGNVYFIH
jgi:hypothetical protein